ncbi:hypothetical protein GJV44_00712 [Candidatus Vallotia cooleyia]|nr:hypothetical protein GJV44_00712 [Candidatus Vallotia cooleyia]
MMSEFYAYSQYLTCTVRMNELFQEVAHRFSCLISRHFICLLKTLNVTQAQCSEYDHLMLHLYGAIKVDLDDLHNALQQIMLFLLGSVWVCCSS